MKVVSVRFTNYQKDYAYYTNIPLIVGATYKIVADGTTEYKTPVVVIGFGQAIPSGVQMRTITKAELLSAPKVPESKIKNVYFNEKKGATTVLWKDGTTTTVMVQEGDTFSKEVGILYCFMKRLYGNRGCYNDELKRWAR